MRSKRAFGKDFLEKFINPPLELETKSVFTPKNPLRKETKILNFQKILNPQKKNSPDSKKSITFEKLSNRPPLKIRIFSLLLRSPLLHFKKSLKSKKPSLTKNSNQFTHHRRVPQNLEALQTAQALLQEK